MKLINELLTTPEDEYHDFKAQWYEQYTKSELIKDIFSFVNTSHHKDCYLIIGVNDISMKLLVLKMILIV